MEIILYFKLFSQFENIFYFINNKAHLNDKKLN